MGLAPIERVSTSSLTEPIPRKTVIGLLTDAEGDGMNSAHSGVLGRDEFPDESLRRAVWVAHGNIVGPKP